MHEEENNLKEKRQLLWIPLFWGSLWGLAEATLGHVLHHIPIQGIAGHLMFPIGVFFMLKAYRHSEKQSTMLVVALVAAHIKLTGLLLPARSPFTVINPAIAILCESCVLALFIKLKDFRKILSRLDIIFVMVLTWRSLYGAMTFSLGSIFPVHNFTEFSSAYKMELLLLESAISAALIFMLVHKSYFPIQPGSLPFPAAIIKKPYLPRQIGRYPLLNSVSLVVIAIAVELFLF